MTQDEAARLVAVMLAAVPSHRVEAKAVPGMVAAYADLLADLSYAQCNAALRVLLQTRTWLPSVADIRAAALELDAGPVRAGGDAWGGVIRAIAAEGAYREPGRDFVFADAVTARCVQALGWQNLCLSENQVSDRAQFVRLYDELATQGRRVQQSPQLAAAHEQRELAKREQVDALVGDLTKRLTRGEA